MEINIGKGTKENHVSLDLPENMGQEKILLTQKENIAKKRNKESRKKICKEKWQQSCQISYKKMDNNSSSPIIDANLKLSSDDGMTPSNCLTL